MNVTFRRWYKVATKYGIIIILLGSLTCYILLLTGMITDWKVLIGAAIGVLIGIVALILEERKAVNELEMKVDGLIENSAPQLLPLYICQKDFRDKLSEIKPGNKIVIRHLGLDMSQAWSRIMQMLDQTKLSKIEIYILLITCDSKALGENIPKEATYWCANAEKSLERMKDSLEKIKNQGKVSKLVVKQYTEVPTCHGFALVEPFKISYFSFCRWESNSHYSWGEEKYWKISGDAIDPKLNDMNDIFTGMFQHLWHSSADPVLEWEA